MCCSDCPSSTNSCQRVPLSKLSASPFKEIPLALHIAHVYKKGRRSLGIIRRAGLYSARGLLLFYTMSHVCSTMEYCCPIWTGNTALELSRLDTVHRSAMRLMGGPCGKDLHTLSHRGVAALCAFHRIVHGTAPPAISHLCLERIPARSRPSRAAPGPGPTSLHPEYRVSYCSSPLRTGSEVLSLC